MKNKKLLYVSLILFVLVLIGVMVMQIVADRFEWLETFAPMIVITGFFVFLISVLLFFYVIITNVRER